MNTNMEINAAELLEAPRKASLFKRVLSYFLCFLMFYYPVSPAWAQVLSDVWFESELSLNALFQPSDVYNTNALYEGALNISDEDLAKYESYPNVEDFFELTKDYERLDLSDPSYVPVMIGGNPIFVPTYPNQFLYQPQYASYPAVGTAFVQARIVSGQMRELLGRSLIDPENPIYADELTQLTTLYNNALDFARDNSLYEYGEPLKRHQNYNRESFDFIWPEVRMVQGQKVIVPVVYLSSQTVDDRKVEGIVNEVDGSITADSLVIDGVDLQMGRDSFIKLANDLINHQGEITSEGDLEIVAGGAVRNLSGTLSSEAGLSITAQHIENRTLVYRYDLEGTQGQYLGEIAAINSQNELELVSHGDIYFMAAAAAAGTDLTLDAGGDIWLGSEQLNDYGNIDQGGWNGVWSSVDHLVSKLSAGGTLSLIADGAIQIDAADITSKGHIEILAGMGITIDSELSQYQYSKGGKFGKKKIEESVYQTVAIRALLDAGKGVRLHTEFGDIKLRSAKIYADEGAVVEATNGAVQLLMTTETDHYSYSSVKEGMFTVSTKQQGHIIESGVPNTIVGGLVIEALNGVQVEYTGDSTLTLDQQINQLSKMPGLEWMAEVRAQTDIDVDWDAMSYQYETWKESNTSLTPAFAAVVSIALAIAMGPSGLSIGSMVSTGTGFIATSLSAGAVALATQASMAVINGAVNGDIGQAMEDFASDETLKSLAVTMVTAGAIAELDAAFFDIESAAISDVLSAGPATPEMLQQAAENAVQSLGSQIAQAVTHSVVRSGINIAVNGGSSDEFADLFLSNLGNFAVNRIGQEMAEEIGALYKAGDIENLVRYMAHAGAGCLIGAASSSVNGGDSDSAESDCVSGAGGAVVGEYVADSYKEAQIEAFLNEEKQFFEEQGITEWTQDSIADLINSPAIQERYAARFSEIKAAGVNLSKLSAAFAAMLAGGNVNIAAMTAENAAANNAFFFVPLALLALKAIDTALTANDLWEIYTLFRDGNSQEGSKQLALFFGEGLAGRVIPGFKTSSEMLAWLKNQDLLSESMVVAIEKVFVKKSGDIKPPDIDFSSKKTVQVSAGSKGDWDKTINGKLEADTIHVLDNGHVYVTDSAGRVQNVGGEVGGIKLDRNKYQQLCAGKEGCDPNKKYDGGHLIATHLGGAGDKINLVPMERVLNRIDYREMERELHGHLVNKSTVELRIDVSYPDAKSTTPNALFVIAWVDGKSTTYKFEQ